MSDASSSKRNIREEKIKKKSGFIVSIFTMFLAINTYINNGFSNTVLSNTIQANDVWAFYQAKSIKQTVYEVAADNVENSELKRHYKEVAARLESDKKTGEGKKELIQKGKELETERDYASLRGSWLSIAGSAMQISLLLISAATVTANYYIFTTSIVSMLLALVFMSQGLLLWFPW